MTYIKLTLNSSQRVEAVTYSSLVLKETRGSLNILGRLFGYRTQSYRPDIMPHLMTTIISGEKRVLSWRRYKKTSRKPLSVANAQTAKDYFEIYKGLVAFSKNINCKRYVDVNLGDLEPVRISMNKYSDKQQIVVGMVAMNRANQSFKFSGVCRIGGRTSELH